MADWYCSIDGTQYGPVSDTDLKLWVDQGRVRPSDLVWREGMAEWVAAGSVPSLFGPAGAIPPAATVQMVAYVSPHRGATVLVLGILGIVLCFICGIIAWSMGSADLKEMAAGRMDRSGEGMTQAGRICGIVGSILGILGVFGLCCGSGLVP